MKKFLCIILLLASCNTFAGKFISKSQCFQEEFPQEKTEPDMQEDQPLEQEQEKLPEEKIECGRCKRLWDSELFVEYCKMCNNKLCESCDWNQADRTELFLDKTADSFFTKSTCFNYQKEILSYGHAFDKKIPLATPFLWQEQVSTMIHTKKSTS